MSLRVTQSSFNAGEVSPTISARVDDSKYKSALMHCENAVCMPQGPVRNRPGFVYVAKAKYADKPTRLIPFTYSTTETMVIELGEKYARFHTNGKTLMDSSGTRPYEISTPWRSEDLFQLHYVQNADIMTIVHPAYKPRELRRYSRNDWRLVDVNLVTTLAAPSGVTANRITEAADDKNKEKYTQKYVVTALNADRTEESVRSSVASVVANLFATGTTVQVSWNRVTNAAYYRVYKLQGGLYGFIGETSETSIVDDNIAPETGETPPYIDDVFKVTGGITRVDVISSGSGYKPTSKVTGVVQRPYKGQWYGYLEGKTRWWPITEENLGKGFTPPTENINQLSLGYWFDELGAWNSYAKVINVGESSGSGATIHSNIHYEHSWPTDVNVMDPIVVTNGGRGYTDAEVYVESPRHKVWHKCLIAEEPIELVVEDPTGYGAKLIPEIDEAGRFTGVRVLYSGQGYTNPTVRVVSASGSGASFRAYAASSGDFPSAVGYFEQRRVFAGSPLRPQTIWMTATGTESNMTFHLPLQDDDRISFKVASRDLNMIQHVVALQQLLVLTSAAEWRVSPLNSDAITPTSISVRPQSYVGASQVQPVLVNNNLLYPAARGGGLNELSYNYTAGGYITGDLSIRAQHLTEGLEIKELCLSKAPYPVCWSISSSGKLLGLTYVPEQQVGAWHQHTTQGFFESCTAVQEGDVDAVYVVTRRNIGGKMVRFVERLAKRVDAPSEVGVYLDCSGVYSSTQATEKAKGFTWLAGEKVSVNADGVCYEDVEVSSDGTITLPVAAQTIVAGFAYTTRLKTMPLVAGVADGSLGRGRVKGINKVWLGMYRTADVDAGPSGGDLIPVKARREEGYGKPPAMLNGGTEIPLLGEWSLDGSVVIEHRKPRPFTLLTITAEYQLGG